MKKILAVSLVAMMAVSTARADIASTAYVTGAVNAEKALRESADTAIKNSLGTVSAANMGTTATTVVAAIKEHSDELATMAASETVEELQADVSAIETSLASGGATANAIAAAKKAGDDAQANLTTHISTANSTYATKTALSEGLAGKQATLTTSNIKGSGSVSVGISNGVITVTGTDNNTTYSTGTASTAGLTKLYTGTGSGTDGTMTQSAITTALNGKLGTSGTAAKATADASGNNIVDTYATKTALSGGLALKEDVSNKANAITDDMDKEASYPTVALMETRISSANNELGIDVLANTQAIAAMDLAQVGADGSYIKTVKQADGKVTATAEAADTTPTASSEKMVTSGGVYTALSGKQATLTTTQLNAANSGITAAKVTSYDTAVTNASTAKGVTDAITGASQLAAGTAGGTYVLTMSKDGTTGAVTYKWEQIDRSY